MFFTKDTLKEKWTLFKAKSLAIHLKMCRTMINAVKKKKKQNKKHEYIVIAFFIRR